MESSGNSTRIIIQAHANSTAPLSDLLSDHTLSANGVQVSIAENTDRSIDPTVLVALVAATGTAMGALITGILKIAAHGKASTIVMYGKSGRRLEIPADLPADRVREFAQIARDLDLERLEL
jgi:hypothetical protein